MIRPMIRTTTTLRRFTAATLVLLAVAAAPVLWACDSDGDGDNTPAPGATGASTAARSPGASTPRPEATEPAVTSAPPGPATFRVIGGRNEGPIDIEQFLPRDVRVRVGDTIEWTSRGYEGHTITFAPPDYLRTMGDYLVPDPEDPEQLIFNDAVALRTGNDNSIPGDGGVHSSGFVGVPAEGTYKLTFTEQGIYEYLCVVHPLWMRGTVTVDDAGAQVDSPESVAAAGERAFEELLDDARAEIDAANAADRDAPAIGDATLHRVQVGLTTMYGQAAMFFDNAIDINAGDTVIFENDDRNFHNVVFKGDRPEFPPAYEIRVDPAGRGFNVALAKESARQVDPPASGFDSSAFLSSGTMGTFQPRQTWRLTFTTPGTYVYNCTIHQFAGMAGVITVH